VHPGAENSVELGARKLLQKGLFNNIIGVGGFGSDVARYVADGGDDVGQQCTDDV
jgi:hypothetical protein